jgi:hypothetical protein
LMCKLFNLFSLDLEERSGFTVVVVMKEMP